MTQTNVICWICASKPVVPLVFEMLSSGMSRITRPSLPSSNISNPVQQTAGGGLARWFSLYGFQALKKSFLTTLTLFLMFFTLHLASQSRSNWLWQCLVLWCNFWSVQSKTARDKHCVRYKESHQLSTLVQRIFFSLKLPWTQAWNLSILLNSNFKNSKSVMRFKMSVLLLTLWIGLSG